MHVTGKFQLNYKGNNCFHNRNSEFTFAETHENVAEICIFYVSIDVFRTTECVMELLETQEAIWKLMSVSCFPLLAFVSQTCYFKIIFHLRKVSFFLFSCFLKRTLIMCMVDREPSYLIYRRPLMTSPPSVKKKIL